MYFSFYKSGINKTANNEVLVPQNFSQPTDHTNVRHEASPQAPSSKKETLENEHFKLAQQKFLERGENRKSPLPYIGMIAEAINSSPTKKMVLSEIYAYMEHHFCKYLSGKPRWRNTVRHNLSFHNCFVKCECSRRGNRSHFWSIHPDYNEQFKRGNFTKTLSRTREQTNTSSYTLELQNLRRNSYENYQRFLQNSEYGESFHYESNAPLGALYQAIPPPSNVLFPRHDLRSFPMVESSSSRGNFGHISVQVPDHEGNQRFFSTDAVTPPYQYQHVFPITWQPQQAPTHVSHEAYLDSTSRTPPNAPNIKS